MNLWIAAALACGQLAIDGPREIPEHRAVRLSASLAPSAEAIVLWDVQPLAPEAGDDEIEILKEEPGALWFNAGPGRYSVRLVVKEPKAPQRSARLTVVVLPRQPAPKPEPVVPPAPKAVVVTIVDDAAARAPEFGALFVSPHWRQALVAEGHAWHWLDIGNELVVRQRLDRAVKAAGGTPALIVQAPDGRVLAAVKCPADEPALLAAVRAAAKLMETLR